MRHIFLIMFALMSTNINPVDDISKYKESDCRIEVIVVCSKSIRDGECSHHMEEYVASRYSFKSYQDFVKRLNLR